MPLYEYECECGNRFEGFHCIEDRHNVVCPCGEPATLKISLSDFRFAEPLTILQDLGSGRGYKKLGWIADSGITPKLGQPYKTAKDLMREA